MKITLSQLIKNTALRNFTIQNKEALQEGKISGRQKKIMLKKHEKLIRRDMEKNSEFRQICLDICKYGNERAKQLSILRREF